MQDTSLVYRDQILTNIMLGYKQKGLVYDQLLPTLHVPDLTGIAFQQDESHLVAPLSTERAAFARANRVSWGLTSVSYGPLKERSLETGITDQIMRLYKEPLQPETRATTVVTSKIALEKEIAVMTKFTTLANFASTNKVTLSGTTQFDNAASDPIGVATTAARAIKLGCGSQPNVVVMNPDVRDGLRNNAAIKARINYAARLTKAELDAQIADVLGVERIIVAEGVKSNQAEESTTAGTKSYIWGDDMLFAYVTSAPALEELSLGYILQLDPEHTLSGANGQDIFTGVDKWYEQSRKSTFVRANDFYDLWTVSALAGYLVKDCLSTF
jgi:hypothetical protein